MSTPIIEPSPPTTIASYLPFRTQIIQEVLCEIVDAFEFPKHIQYVLKLATEGFIEAGVSLKKFCAEEQQDGCERVNLLIEVCKT